MKKVILKINDFLMTNEQQLIFRQKVIEQLNTDGVSIVPSWCDVFVLDDKGIQAERHEDK